MTVNMGNLIGRKEQCENQGFLQLFEVGHSRSRARNAPPLSSSLPLSPLRVLLCPWQDLSVRTQVGVAVLHKGNFEVRVHAALPCPPARTLLCFSSPPVRRCSAARAWSSVSCCTRSYSATAAPLSLRRPSSEHVTNWRR